MPPIKKSKNKLISADNFHNNIPTNKGGLKMFGKNVKAFGESQQKILNVVKLQQEVCKLELEKVLKKLSKVIENYEGDYNMFKENKPKLEMFVESYMQQLQQIDASYKQKINAAKEIHADFKKRLEELEGDQNAEVEKMGDKLDDDMNKFKQKLISETKLAEKETMHNEILQMVQKI